MNVSSIVTTVSINASMSRAPSSVDAERDSSLVMMVATAMVRDPLEF